MPSALPLFSGTVISVIHALKAASLLVEPKGHHAVHDDNDGNGCGEDFDFVSQSEELAYILTEMKAKTMTEMPQRI